MPGFSHHLWYHLLQLRRAIEQSVTDVAAPESNQTVIDFGAGDLRYKSLFERHNFAYVSCDIEGDCDVVCEPGTPLAIPDVYADVVASFQVLEHVWDLDWYLGECLRVLKSEGYLLLSTHGTWLYHPHPTDYRRWTRDGLSKELESRGFTVRQMIPIIGPLAWTTQIRLLGIRYALQKIPVLGNAVLLPITWWMNLRMMLEDYITPQSVLEANASVFLSICQKR